MELENKRVVVLGLGISGMEVARFLAGKGAHVTVRDDADTPVLRARAGDLRALGVRAELGGNFPRAEAPPFDFAVLSPGIDPAVPLVRTLAEAGLPLMSELELAYHFCACPIIAVTGTNGKTTTTEVIAAVLREAGRRTMTSGNIGVAFSRAVAESRELDFMTLEVSSFQLECIRDFRPAVSVHLNLTPDHLDRYPDMTAYRDAKWRIFENQTPDDIAVVNAELELPPGLRARKVTLSAFGRPADYQYLDGWLVARGERVLPLSGTHLVGPHNAENLLAALAVADAVGAGREAAVRAFQAYRPLPHRLEKVAEVRGIRFLNDSKATNIDALEKALLAMASPVVLIAGGKDKGLDFAGLRPLVRERVREIVLIGQMAGRLSETWGDLAPCHLEKSLEAAVARASALARPGDTVLFSPGCSSYDMFRNFEERGDRFRQAVLAGKPE